jgi:hypothetical protein
VADAVRVSTHFELVRSEFPFGIIGVSVWDNN